MIIKAGVNIYQRNFRRYIYLVTQRIIFLSCYKLTTNCLKDYQWRLKKINFHGKLRIKLEKKLTRNVQQSLNQRCCYIFLLQKLSCRTFSSTPFEVSAANIKVSVFTEIFSLSIQFWESIKIVGKVSTRSTRRDFENRDRTCLIGSRSKFF